MTRDPAKLLRLRRLARRRRDQLLRLLVEHHEMGRPCPCDLCSAACTLLRSAALPCC